jgi:uncharacterized protein (DUF433 family)
MERSSAAKRRLARAEALVLSHPGIMGGEPCIRGTRVPVYLIGALAHAHGVRRTHEMYPFLTEEQIELVSLYVTVHPEKGRRQTARLPKATATKRITVKKVRI